jgi:hypothetical protein
MPGLVRTSPAMTMWMSQRQIPLVLQIALSEVPSLKPMKGFPHMSGIHPRKKRKSGVPTGNAGEYFVMGELLRQGFDAQLADRNTKGYDLLVGSVAANNLEKVQVKTVRSPPWYVTLADFQGEFRNRMTIYVLLGPENSKKPVRFFIAKNAELAEHIHRPASFKTYGFMQLKFVSPYEDRWDTLPGYALTSS